MFNSVPSGTRLSDNTYLWKCENHKSNCPYCCDFDKTKLIESLTRSRGKIYYSNLKAFLSLYGKEIYDCAVTIRNKENKFSPTHLLMIVDKFDLPRNRTKIIAEWLEETGFLPSGTYHNLLSRGFKPTIQLENLEKCQN